MELRTLCEHGASRLYVICKSAVSWAQVRNAKAPDLRSMACLKVDNCRKWHAAIESPLIALIAATLAASALIYRPAEIPRPNDFTLLKDFSAFALGSALFIALAFRADLKCDVADYCILGLAAATVASVAYATNKHFAITATGTTVSASAIFLATRQLSTHAKKTLVVVVVGIGFLASSVAFLEAIQIIAPMSQIGRGPAGTMGNRNYLAHILAVTYPIAA